MSAQLDFGTFDDHKDLEVVKIKDRNIIVVGLTGSGKSSIIKSLCNPEEPDKQDKKDIPDVKMSFKSVTKNLMLHENNLVTNPIKNNDQYMINLFDTVGLGDTDVDVPEIMRQIIQFIPKNLSKIHRIVFCFKMDRLRAKMSEALNLMYSFFKLVGAKPENFVVVLTFCDILRDGTISSFWNELKEAQPLEMMKEIETVTFTSFPNFSECDTNQHLVSYLKEKTRVSKRRIFQKVIEADCQPFYPYETITQMQKLNFDQMCEMLVNYKPRSQFWRFFSGKNERQDMIDNLQKLRTPLTNEGEKKKSEAAEQIS